MELSPKSALIGVVVIITVAVFGAVESPTNATQIFGFCTMAVLTLLGIVNQQRLSKKADNLDRKVDQNTQLTVEAKQEAKAAKQALAISDADKSKKFDELKKAVDTVVKQTNGPLTEQLHDIKATVEEVKQKLPDPPAP